LQITKSKEFNTGFAFNEKAELPDYSGKFETTTGVYSDIIQSSTCVLEIIWSLIDPVYLILKLASYRDLTIQQKSCHQEFKLVNIDLIKLSKEKYSFTTICEKDLNC
tara:strand:- start:6182 stop:6502 length:321 start_codon:yes stop_codon:yes gene_type:complete